MKAVFSGYYSPTEEEFEQLWSECLFVFDTNTLLNLYRYSKESRELLFKVMETIVDRIWIPHQVALEYHKHMLVEINNQKNEYKSISEKVTKFVTSLQGELSDLRHSNINADRINELLKGFENKIKDEIKLQESSQPDLDLIKEKIDVLFTGKLGPEYTQMKLNEIYELGNKRYENKIPPGYKDSKEKDAKVTFTNGLEYIDKYGDLIYWFQILDKSKDQLVKSIILITDDNKEDWVLTIKGQKKGPQPELVHEFKRVSGNKLFYLYNTEQFLSQAQKYFGKSINNHDLEKAIEDVKSTKKFLNEQNKIISSVQKNFNDMVHKNALFDEDIVFHYDVFAELQGEVQDIFMISTFFTRDMFYLTGEELNNVQTIRLSNNFVSIQFYSDILISDHILIHKLNEHYSSIKEKQKFVIKIIKVNVTTETIPVP
ncbi:PIN-like domain-containing protein [Paenibacillus sp. FSL R5-0407]|uniref:PIN-like domain-containing protein n=1 Tax=Paenibacillus sp. FSL R5-0407 TaxID=2975320 RepID=UPI0030F87869